MIGPMSLLFAIYTVEMFVAVLEFRLLAFFECNDKWELPYPEFKPTYVWESDPVTTSAAWLAVSERVTTLWRTGGELGYSDSQT